MKNKYSLMMVAIMFFGVCCSSVPTFADTSATDSNSIQFTIHVTKAEQQSDDPTPTDPDDPTPTDPDNPPLIDPAIDDGGGSDDPTPTDPDDPTPTDPDDPTPTEPDNPPLIDPAIDDGGGSDNPTPTEPDNTPSSTDSTAENKPSVEAPNTGDNTNGIIDYINDVPLLALVPIVLSLILIISIIKKHNRRQVATNRFRIHKPLYRSVPLVILGLTAITFACFEQNGPSKQAETAIAYDYPYTVNSSVATNFDISVKQGETKKSVLEIKTSTDNETGFTLSMSAEQTNLTLNGKSIKTISGDTNEGGFANNTYGFSTDGAVYHKMLNKSTGGTMIQQTSAATNGQRTAKVYFFVKIAEDLPAGDYVTTLHIDAKTNLVKKKLSLANGNVATVTRLSDNSAIGDGDDLILGEQIRISNRRDAAGIIQTVSINDNIVSSSTGNTVLIVTDNIAVATKDDSIHFLKNYYYNDDHTDSTADAILIRSQGKYWLVDAGRANWEQYKDSLSGKRVAEYLDKLNIKSIDYFLATHMHGDHIHGTEYLAANGYLNENTAYYYRGCESTAAIDNCNRMVSKLEQQGVKLTSLYKNESLRSYLCSNGLEFGNFHISFYNIESGGNGHIASFNDNEENLYSIGTKFTHTPSGKTVFLAGDMHTQNEVLYASKIGKVDILKMSHHGLLTSNSYNFIKALKPSDAIITRVNNASPEGGIFGNDQAAAQAYIQQNGGSVYFTGQSTSDAIAVAFKTNGYSILNAVADNITAKANTANNPTSYDGGVTTFRWGGGLIKWLHRVAETGTRFDDSQAHYVYVYQKPSEHNGHIIAVSESKCIGGYLYQFNSEGVAPKPTVTCSN